ncbi:MAG: TfoX/Sxy family protein [Rhodocyclaceae bacterium]|nr:TfoX/Sxy family protein [Rhodocyclaceae bacterium]
MDSEFVAYLIEQLQGIGPVRSRRMFGGWGFFLDGLMFGLIIGDVLYFKADGESADDFAAQGLPPFTYERKGKKYALGYYQAPEDALEDRGTLCLWANKAFAAALRAAAKQRKRR